ncbi:class I SAM-dependent methyltransferase [Devosia sp. BK]|nr:class I SAM-dependent methyltransferase [Devosia sp. BK]
MGIDINSKYVADAQARLGDKIVGLETICADIEKPLSGIEPVDLIYAALVFEYVDTAKAMRSLRALCAPRG